MKLHLIFNEINRSVVDGVAGVWIVNSKKPGPIIGITIGTHGNEPSGLLVYHYFRHVYKLEKKLRRGSIYFVLNNPRAMERYFHFIATGDDIAKQKARFIDVNMNRLSEDVFTNGDKFSYEIQRARELQKIWDCFQYGLDIHSTIESTKPMIIALGRSDIKTVSHFPISTIISGIDLVQIGKPASYFYGNKKAIVYGIEVGGHELKSSFSRAIVCAKNFLGSLGAIPNKDIKQRKIQELYQVFDSVLFPDDSYELTHIFKSFESIKRGQILARGDGHPIIAKTDCYALMPPKNRRQMNIHEEVFFIAHRSPDITKTS